MPRVTLPPELRVYTFEPLAEKSLAELPTALGVKFDCSTPKKPIRAIEEVETKTDKVRVGHGLAGPGRTTKYGEDEMENRAYELALLGCSEKVMSVALGITVETLRDWMKTKPRFSVAIREGKTLADAKVARKIYEQALEGSISHQKWWMSVRQRGLFPILDEKSGLVVNVNAMQPPAFVINPNDPVEAAKLYQDYMRDHPPVRTIEHEPSDDD